MVYHKKDYFCMNVHTEIVFLFSKKEKEHDMNVLERKKKYRLP